MSLSTLRQKIVLGTAQLGLPYGINNLQGKPDKQVAFQILDLARQHNISILDTADAYGDAVAVIGDYCNHTVNSGFDIINKFVDDGISLEAKLEKSLQILKQNALYAYLFHRFADYSSGKFAEDLRRLKEDRKIERIGVSVYSLGELDQVINDVDVDLIQIPLNPFDCSAQKKNLLKQAKVLGKEIHVRSVFLQGLLFKTPDQLSGNLKGFYESLKQFHRILTNHNLNVRQACLNYALHQAEVDHVLIGVETTTQFHENMNSIFVRFSDDVIDQLEAIAVPDASLLNPSNWRP